MPRPCHSLRQRLSPLKGLGVLLMVLGLLLATPTAFGQGPHVPQTTAPSAMQTVSPAELPHCHHGHGWRVHLDTALRTSPAEPDGEAPPSTRDATNEPPPVAATVIPRVNGPAPRVPLYLLTQRFRS